jgi:hypothetical protein
MRLRFNILACLLLLAGFAAQAQVSPMTGIATYQLLDNTGKPVAGALYFYQAGTSTQQATYTDATGTVQNPNPLAVGAGGRATVWLTTSAFYKIVGCLSALDGAACAPADVLFSIDSVPGGATSSGGGGGAPFISNSANPATSGILRLASGDSIGWRNAGNSGNLFLTKDANDILGFWGSVKFPAVTAPGCLASFSQLWMDSSANRFKMCNNGGGAAQIVASGMDINASDQVTQVHFGAAAVPFGTAPSTGQFLKYDGANIVGGQPESVWSIGATAGTSMVLNATTGTCATAPVQTNCLYEILPSAHTIVRLTYQLQTSPAGCATAAVVGVYDVTSTSVLTSLTVTNGLGIGFIDSGALSISTTAGHKLALGITTQSSGCGTNAVINGLSVVLQ